MCTRLLRILEDCQNPGRDKRQRPNNIHRRLLKERVSYRKKNCPADGKEKTENHTLRRGSRFKPTERVRPVKVDRDVHRKSTDQYAMRMTYGWQWKHTDRNDSCYIRRKCRLQTLIATGNQTCPETRLAMKHKQSYERGTL